jgi:hypothetical protein
MSVHYSYWVTCDACGQEISHPDSSSEEDALELASESGWGLDRPEGDLCPDCYAKQ